MHEVIREHAMAAWAEMAQGRANPLADMLCTEARVLAHMSADEARALLDASGYTGDAPQRTRALVRMIREELANPT
jgi:adenylosuccinate lyase